MNSWLLLVRVILITFIPTLELRASIPYGIIYGSPWFLVFITAVITNFLLGLLLYLLIEKFIIIAESFKPFKRFWILYVEKTQKKIHKYVKCYGELAVAVFIAIPLPGSGVYTGALAAYLIGLKFKKFVIADAIGVFIAGIIVTGLTMTGVEFVSFFK